MNLRISILLFLAPFLSFAIYLILDEKKDPLAHFHDEYRKVRFGVSEEREPKALQKSSVSENQVLIIGSTVIALLIALAGLGSALLFPMVILMSGIYFWRRQQSSRNLKKILTRQAAEFPAIVELLAILVAAGESPSLALVHIAERTSGSLSEVLQEVAGELRRGGSFLAALENLGENSFSDPVKRLCDSLIVAVERGTPIVEVLQSQVVEARSAEQNRLIKGAGRAEIALMIPIVFLILPISILFALWPSYVTLGISMQS